MKYQIVEEVENGVFCRVTRDDGTSFGQTIYGEAAKSVGGIEEVILAAEKLIDLQAKPTDADVRAAIDSKVEKVLLRNAKAAIP